jgi:hypothetical protein
VINLINLDDLNPLVHYKKFWYTVNVGIYNDVYFITDINHSSDNVIKDANLRDKVYYNPRFDMAFVNFEKLGKTLTTVAYSTQHPNVFYIELEQVDAIILAKTIIGIEIIEESSKSIYHKLQHELLPKVTLTSIQKNMRACEDDGYDKDLDDIGFYTYTETSNTNKIYYIKTTSNGTRTFINYYEEVPGITDISDISDASLNKINVMLVKKGDTNGAFALHGSLSRQGGYFYIRLNDAMIKKLNTSLTDNASSVQKALGGSLAMSYQGYTYVGLYEIQKVFGSAGSEPEYDCQEPPAVKNNTNIYPSTPCRPCIERKRSMK